MFQFSYISIKDTKSVYFLTYFLNNTVVINTARLKLNNISLVYRCSEN
jgi:hypothetical protein